MSYVLYFFLAFATLLGGTWIGAERLEESKSLAPLLPLVFLLPHGLAWIGRRMLLRERLWAAVACEWLLRFAPVYLQAIAFLGLGGFALLQSHWPSSLGELSGDDVSHWPELALAAALSPYVLLQVLVIDARARMFGGGAWLGRVRSFQLRMFASLLVPFALLSLLSGLIGLSPAWSARLEEVGLLAAGLGICLVLLAVLTLPKLLTLVWKTESLPSGSLRARLENLGARAGLRFRDLMLWRTGGMLPNALIMGFTPGTRRILMTDALMDLLSEDELEAVFGHEMGHAKGHHGLWLAALVLGALLGTELLIESIAPSLAASSGLGLDVVYLGLLLLAILGWARAFGVLAHGLEMEADLASLRTTGDLGAILSTLIKVTGAGNMERSSWRHPSTSKRVDFLLAASRDPGLGRRLVRRLGWIRRLALSLFLSAICLRGFQAFRSWDQDWLRVELRLGDYQAAQARLASGIQASEPLRALVSMAADLDPQQVDTDEMLAMGLRSLRGGNLVRSMQLLELAYLRGRREVGGLLEALDGLSVGIPLVKGDLTPAWQQAFEAYLKLQPELSTQRPGD